MADWDFLDDKKYHYLSLRKKQIILQMCDDVTEDEIKATVNLFKQHHEPELARRLQQQYSHMISYKSYQGFIDLGITFDDKKIKRNCSGSISWDDLTANEWAALNLADFEIHDIGKLKKMLANLKKKGKKEEAEKLKHKYQYLFDEQQAKYREKFELGEKAEGSFICWNEMKGPMVDGMSPRLWRAFNDPDYVPPLSHLRNWIKKLEAGEDDKAVMFLMQKYEPLLIKDVPEPEMSLEQAQAFLNFINSNDYVEQFLAENKLGGEGNDNEKSKG